MKLAEILKPEHVIANLDATTRDEVIAEMVQAVIDELPLPAAEVVKLIIERENQASTAMSGGMALPHARLESMDGFVLALGRSLKGVPFGRKDEKTNIFFLLLSPAGDTTNHLKILARIARICRSEGFKKDVLSANSAREIYDRLIKEDEAL